jgi:hypothetical protein
MGDCKRQKHIPLDPPSFGRGRKSARRFVFVIPFRRQRWIDAVRVRELAAPLAKTGYGQYLLRLIDGH